VIELKEPRPPAPSEAVAEAEERLAALGRPLPASYRAFLAEQDGGRPVRNTFTFEQNDREQSSRVAAFLGVLPAPDGDLAGTAERLGDLPPGMLAFAGDEFGNYICLDGEGRVRFWDHEEEFGNVYDIAPDLEAFLDGLSEPEPAPAQPEPERSGWRRLFGR
jgi:hypothetical protein